MDAERFERYLVWRSARLERQYAKVLRVMQWTAVSLLFSLLVLSLGGYLILFRDFEPGRMQGYGLFAVGLFAIVTVMFHFDARKTREDIDEELDVIYSLFPQDEILDLHGRERSTVYPHDRATTGQ